MGVAYNDKHYILVEDINLSMHGSQYNSGKGWIPIGTTVSPFGGVFNGNGKTITRLFINDPTLPAAGLFGEIVGSVAGADLQVCPV